MSPAALLESIRRHMRFLTPDERAALEQSKEEKRAEEWVAAYIKRIKVNLPKWEQA